MISITGDRAGMWLSKKDIKTYEGYIKEKPKKKNKWTYDVIGLGILLGFGVYAYFHGYH